MVCWTKNIYPYQQIKLSFAKVYTTYTTFHKIKHLNQLQIYHKSNTKIPHTKKIEENFYETVSVSLSYYKGYMPIYQRVTKGKKKD